MSLPDKCPFCGAGEEGRNSIWVTFDCHTTMHTDGESRRFQAPECKDAERTRLAARLAALEARCKRLEEAGDRLAAFTPSSSDRFGAWRKAKEAKP